MRVYRRLRQNREQIFCSLTVCEGISLWLSHKFPEKSVPSLYVRVYHVQNICTESPYRSLIIREGISDGGEEE